jgi:hypothetical protein
MSNLEEIKAPDGTTIAIILESTFHKDGVNFLSKEEFPLQLGISSYKQGQKITPHIHLDRKIIVENIQEAIYIKNGQTVVNLYDKTKKLFQSVILSAGDLIFFIAGGHGFEMLQDTTLIEIKQGPYLGKNIDKEMIE